MNKNVKKILVALIYGGISFEHEISIKSAINIIKNIDFNKFELLLIGINKNRSWHIEKINNFTNINLNIKNILYTKKNILKMKLDKNISFYKKNSIFTPDVFFPITHGIFGEDGNIQSIINILNIPFVGSDVKSSCICMNKDLFKIFLKKNKFPIIPYLLLNNNNILDFSFEKIKKIFGIFFIKPSNQGSSIGITLVKKKKIFLNGISKAFYFSKSVIIEPLIIGREIECGIINNYGKLIISDCYEIIKKNNFYSFNQKYLNFKNKITIVKNIKKNILNKIKEYSLKLFKLLECKDMARIDFIITKKNIFINEINTIPGFTENSIFPLMWKNKGFNTKKLISNLILTSLNNKKI